MTPNARAALVTASTLAVGLAGGLVFDAIGVPAPHLTGPATAVTLAAFLGFRAAILRSVAQGGFLVLGIGIGAGVTPEVLSSVGQWPVSLAALALSLPVAVVLASRLLERCFGFEPRAAVLAASPGHLSFVTAYATEKGLDVGRIAIVQSMRLLLLTLCVPPMLALWGVPGPRPLEGIAAMALLPLLGLTAVGAVLGLAMLRARVPAAMLLGGMGISALGHGAGLTPGGVPEALEIASFTVLGSLIGTRFRGVALGDVLPLMGAGAAVTALTCAIAVGTALLMAQATGFAPTLLLVAYAPGGVETMAAMAVQMGLLPAFVAAHHVARLLVLTGLVPFLLARAGRR